MNDFPIVYTFSTILIQCLIFITFPLRFVLVRNNLTFSHALFNYPTTIGSLRYLGPKVGLGRPLKSPLIARILHPNSPLGLLVRFAPDFWGGSAFTPATFTVVTAIADIRHTTRKTGSVHNQATVPNEETLVQFYASSFSGHINRREWLAAASRFPLLSFFVIPSNTNSAEGHSAEVVTAAAALKQRHYRHQPRQTLLANSLPLPHFSLFAYPLEVANDASSDRPRVPTEPTQCRNVSLL